MVKKKLSPREARVIEIVCESLGVNREEITLQTNFIEDLKADSLDLVELVMEIETEFEVSVSEEETTSFKTVKDVIDWINRQLPPEDNP